MTEREVIENEINSSKACIEELEKCRKYVSEDFTNKMIFQYTTIISALEKQIPKKVVVDKAYSLGRYVVGICPNCKKMLGLLSFAKDFEHCYKCGQALDWSDTE